MPPKQNKKKKVERRTKKSRKGRSLLAIKTFGVSLILGAVSAFGLWKCLDEDSGALLKPYRAFRHIERRARDSNAKKVERQSDPTLIDEEQLLKEEMTRSGKGAEKDAGTPPKTEEPPVEQIDPFPLFAVAFHFHTQVRNAASDQAQVVGYARRGAVFRVGKRRPGPGCAKGWHEIAPKNLFVCAEDGIIVSDKPVTFSPAPPPPNLNAPLPYEYFSVTEDNTPEYWRIPTREEALQVKDIFAGMAPPKATEEALDKAALAAMIAEKESAVDSGIDGEPALPSFVHQRMNRGYYVSLDSRIDEQHPEFRNTIRGRFVSKANLAEAPQNPFKGIALGGDIALPRVFIVSSGASLLVMDQSGAFHTAGKFERHTHWPFLGEVKRRGRHYVEVDKGLYISSRAVSVVRAATSPPDLKPGEHWIHIDLSEQALVAYEGAIPVFATLVSTGKPGFETPPGAYRVNSKHISITMDDIEAGDEAYSIEDVPWTQYFEEGFALHAAFWHNQFGRVQSHGCVNLAPADARRLFFWTTPVVSDGLHGIIGTKADLGTRIIIEE